MPEVNAEISNFKKSMKDFLDVVENRAGKEKLRTTDYRCGMVLNDIQKKASYQKKLFGLF
jgi:hypothetical protein